MNDYPAGVPPSAFSLSAVAPPEAPAKVPWRLLPAAAGRFPELLGLLAQCGLPGDDLSPHGLCGFVQAVVGEELVGNAGVVLLPGHAGVALLRSVAVAPAWRRTGLGQALLRDREAWAQRQGVEELFLITLDAQAAAFFGRHGYVGGCPVPSALARHPDFAFLCGAQCQTLSRQLVGG